MLFRCWLLLLWLRGRSTNGEAAGTGDAAFLQGPVRLMGTRRAGAVVCAKGVCRWQVTPLWLLAQGAEEAVVGFSANRLGLVCDAAALNLETAVLIKT